MNKYLEDSIEILKKHCPNRIEDIFLIIKKYEGKMDFCPSSIQYHHTENLGYSLHVYEVLKIMDDMANSLFDIIDKINIEEAFFVGFIHDLDKLTRYKQEKATYSVPKENGISTDLDLYQGWRWTYANNKSTGDVPKVLQMLAKMNIELNDSELHILAYHHGGWSNISNQPMSSTACFLHCADLMSAKILDENYIY